MHKMQSMATFSDQLAVIAPPQTSSATDTLDLASKGPTSHQLKSSSSNRGRASRRVIGNLARPETRPTSHLD